MNEKSNFSTQIYGGGWFFSYFSFRNKPKIKLFLPNWGNTMKIFNAFKQFINKTNQWIVILVNNSYQSTIDITTQYIFVMLFAAVRNRAKLHDEFCNLSSVERKFINWKALQCLLIVFQLSIFSNYNVSCIRNNTRTFFKMMRSLINSILIIQFLYNLCPIKCVFIIN